jgi:hypothetical protein
VMLRANARALGVPPEDFDGYAAAARSMARGTFLAVGRELMGVLPAQRRRSVQEPCTGVVRRCGAAAHRALPAANCRCVPSGTARVAPGVGHAWSHQAPELFAAAVRAHVAGAPLPEGLSPTSE